VGWQVDGFFATKKGIEYLNDIIGRVTISLADCKPNRLPYKPDTREAEALYYPKIHKLFEFQALKSLKSKTYAPTRADNMGGKDYCFWAIKLYTEDLIRQFGEGTPVPAHLIEDWAYNQFSDHKKGISTVRAKCRSVWHYYDKEGWELPKYTRKRKTKNDEELKMNRKDHIRKVNQNRRIATRNKIKAILDDMFLQETIKKKNGKYKIVAIAELADIDKRTVSEHLKEMGLV
jgi:hypothetical protein